MMSDKPSYKTSRKYKCPYCDKKDSRNNLVEHVDRAHQELIPENYTAARVVFDFINGKDHGICMICKKPVYKWNDKIDRYYNLCDDPRCRAKVREIALERHMKVYNKPTLLNDPEQQEKMLANRHISGKYTFTDGTVFTYTGKYERNALEFMDKVLNIPAKDIQAPGPVLEYEYNGEKHKWITDIYYIPANLLIEIKDGGSNPNTRTMTSYREKQTAKEVMITNLGKFNYIRLTDNNFAQLLNIFADMKEEALSPSMEGQKFKIHINEEVGGLPPQRPSTAYIIPYGMDNAFSGFAYSDDSMDKILCIDNYGNILPMIESTFYKTYDTAPVLIYNKNDAASKINNIHESLENDQKKYNKFYFAEELVGFNISSAQDIIMHDDFIYYDKTEYNNKSFALTESDIENLDYSIFQNNNVIKTCGNVLIHQTDNGIYASTPDDFCISSDYFEDLQSLETSGIIDFMNKIYQSNAPINFDRKENEDE